MIRHPRYNINIRNMDLKIRIHTDDTVLVVQTEDNLETTLQTQANCSKIQHINVSK
jgi:hypothetical protein